MFNQPRFTQIRAIGLLIDLMLVVLACVIRPCCSLPFMYTITSTHPDAATSTPNGRTMAPAVDTLTPSANPKQFALRASVYDQAARVSSCRGTGAVTTKKGVACGVTVVPAVSVPVGYVGELLTSTVKVVDVTALTTPSTE